MARMRRRYVPDRWIFGPDLTDSIGSCAASGGVQNTNPMRHTFRKIVIAADRSGAGKTTVSCGLLAVLKKRSVKVQSFKCGPDYIDPMFHRRVLGVPSGNLDSFFTDDVTLRRIFRARVVESGAELALVEGVMGYYDGLGGGSSRASTWEIAHILDAPTILVLDAKGASVSIAALVRGMMQFKEEREVQSGIRGLILNRVSPMFYPRLKSVIEAYCPGIEVLGYLPELPELQVPSRHLGLVEPAEIEDFQRWTERVAAQMEESVEVERLLEIAGVDVLNIPQTQGNAAFVQPVTCRAMEDEDSERSTVEAEISGTDAVLAAPDKASSAMNGLKCRARALERPVRIAVSEDEAFNFTYEENRALLRQLVSVR